MRSASVIDEIIEALGSQLLQGCRNALHERVKGGDLSRVELQCNGLCSGFAHLLNKAVGFCTIGVVGKD